MTTTRPHCLTVLGIETSCDETAAAVVRGRLGPNSRMAGEEVSQALLSQISEHAPYGGVVPEIAARSHIAHLDGLVRQAMAEAGLSFADLDGIAATAGPGLIGGVIVGLMTAKGIAQAADKPLIAVNHLEGHALSPRLAGEVAFPYLLLLVSGGHCQLLVVRGVGDYHRLGTTIDDAAGEAFDKTAKLLGLGYPGGPALERVAVKGDAARYDLPRPLTNRPGCDFSFSGLKTAVLRTVEQFGPMDAGQTADLAASFQQAAIDCLVNRSRNAMELAREDEGFADLADRPAFVVAGGVAANKSVRGQLEALADEQGFRFVAPPQHLCTDNALMIAWAGLERLAVGLSDPLDVKPRARWPLDSSLEP